MARVEHEIAYPDNPERIHLTKKVALGIADISDHLNKFGYLSAIAIALIPEQTIGATTSDYGIDIEGEGPDRTILQRVVDRYRKRLIRKEESWFGENSRIQPTEAHERLKDYIEKAKTRAANYVIKLKRKT